MYNQWVLINVYSCKHHLNQDTEHVCHSESCLIPLSVNTYPLRQRMLDVYHHILLVLHVLECHINGIIHYAFLCVSLLPLNIMFLKFNYVAFDVSKSFFLTAEYYSTIWPYDNLSILLLMNIWAVSSCGLLWIQPLQTFFYKPFWE